MKIDRSRTIASDRGFTLIELLVVISIIALLIALLLPSLAAARQSAAMMLCQSRIRSVGQAAFLYLNDHKEDYPHGIGYEPAHFYEDLINPYLGIATDTYNRTFLAELWHCPVIWNAEATTTAYSIGQYVSTTFGVFTPNPNIMANRRNDVFWAPIFGNLIFNSPDYVAGTTPYVNETDIKEPSAKNALFMDSCGPRFVWYVNNQIKNYGGFQTTPHFAIGLSWASDLAVSYNDNVASNGLGTAVFRDGHAEALRAVDWVGIDTTGNPSFCKY